MGGIFHTAIYDGASQIAQMRRKPDICAVPPAMKRFGMERNMKKVSVIVPVYNVSSYLPACLDSIAAQTLKDIEIICVDDGSTDGSGGILDEYAAADGRIRVLHKKNTGYGHSMNVGMKEAQGEYTAIVESDDWIQPFMLETLVRLADRNGLDLVKSDFCRFKERPGEEIEVEPVHMCVNPSDYGRVFCPAEKPEAFFAPINTWSGIYRTEFLRKNEIWHNETPGAAYQDNGFWFQTFLYAKRAMFHYESFYMNRRDNQASSVYSREKVYAMCEEYDYIDGILNRLPDRGQPFRKLYGYHRYTNYISTLNRIADECKPAFLNRFRGDYIKSMAVGEIDEIYFPWEHLDLIHQILEDPESWLAEDRRRRAAAEKIIGAAEKIIIYGAGQIGQRLYRDLCNMQQKDKILCFAVSGPCSPVRYMGVPVRCIDEIAFDREKAQIVLAVKWDSENSRQMKQHLDELGCTDYFEY